MKDYNEMAKAVFERRDEFVANRKKQRATLLKAGVPVCALALVCVLGVTLRFDKLPEIPQLPPYSVTETTDENGLTNSTQEITTPENPGNTQNNSDPTQSGEAENRPQTTTSANQNSTRPTENNGVNNDSTDTDDTRPVTPPAQDPTEPSEEMPTQPPSRPGPETTAPPPPSDPNGSEDSEPSISEPDFTEPEESDPWEPEVTEPCIPPDFSEPDMEPETTEPDCSDSTEPDTVTPTEPTEEPTGPLKVNVGGKQYTLEVGDIVRYTAELYAKDYIEVIGAGVLYDSELEVIELGNPKEFDLASIHFENLSSGVTHLNYHRNRNKLAENEIYFDGAYLEGYDFSQQKVLCTFDFVVKKAGETGIKLLVESFTSNDIEYDDFFAGGENTPANVSLAEYLTVITEDQIPVPSEPKEEEHVPEFTYPEESFDGDAQIICGDRTYSADVGDTVTYVVELEAQECFEDIQLMIRHSDALDAQVPGRSENLPDDKKPLPNLTGTMLNCKAIYTHDGVTEPVVRMNAVSSQVKFDFKKRKVLMRVDFIVTEPGEYFIELVMECMSIDSTRCYFDYPEGQQIFEGIEIYEYIIKK